MSQDSVSRRRLIQSMALTVGAGSLAGCQSGGDGGDGGGGGNGGSGNGGGGSGDGGSGGGDMGERVPELVASWWTGSGSTSAAQEEGLANLQSNVPEIGVSVKPQPLTVSKGIGNSIAEAREANLQFSSYNPFPSRLDPDELVMHYHVLMAGSNDFWNGSQFANCEYSRLATKQRQTADVDERQQAVNESQRILSEEVAFIPFITRVQLAAARSDRLEIPDVGNMAINNTAFMPLINFEPKGDHPITIAQYDPVVQTTKFMTVGCCLSPYTLMNTLVYSPLTWYNKDFELENLLATNIETNEGGQQYVVEIRDDAVFHNGDPLTAEDVQFTFQHLRDNAGDYPRVNLPEFESIDIIDETTVEFNLTSPTVTFLTANVPRWGILPKDAWTEAGAVDDPVGFQDPRVGSGPYQIQQFEQGQLLALTPFSDHFEFDPTGEIIFQHYQDAQGASRALQNNEVDIAMKLTPPLADQISSNLGDDVEILSTKSFTNYHIHPQTSFGPTKFREFRMAISQILDRRRINETFALGQAVEQVYGTPLAFPGHPWFPGEDNLPKIADSPRSNPEAARQVLEENGWTWDDDGNLHYPSDADLSPLWPQGSQAADHPDQFPCVEELEL